jgi:spore germination protein Q
MMSYPYNKPGPYGYPAQGQPQTGAGAAPPFPSGSTPPPGYPGYATAPEATAPPPGALVPGQLPLEQSFIENILRLNLGKTATLYMTYENNREWNAKIFKGRLEAAGRDHIIISDPQTGTRYLLLMVNLDYITFDEPLNYFYPLQPGQTAQTPVPRF